MRRLVLAGLLIASTLTFVSTATQPTDCKALLKEFYQFNAKEAAPYTGDNLVYFLHIPRTAGRTFHSCLLRPGTPGSKRCPKAYDHLRIDFSVPQCYLLSSHDDFSVVERLPANTAVVSQLRDPIDRFLSSYEFAIEVAARQLKRSKNYVKPKNRVVTDDVWPWSHLIPFFVDDLSPKVAAARAQPLEAPGVWSEQRTDEGKIYYWNKFLNQSKWTLSDEEKQHLVPNLDAYDNQLFMPLKDFMKHPIATELLHNGEFMQVLGLTNYSHWDKAADMRGCIIQDKSVADELLQFALRRIERFTHVGTTDKLLDSVESAAASLHMKLDDLGYGAGEASSANIEKTRTLTWEEAIKAGEQPTTPADADDTSAYGVEVAGDTPDIHQLATTARSKRESVSDKQKAWNEAIQSQANQTVLRALRGELNAARAELHEAQEHLVNARTEEAKKRGLAEQEAKEGDKRLSIKLGEEFQRCATRAQTRNKARKKNSLLNLRLNDYRQVYFTKEDRKAIPEALIQELKALNSLDVQLHQRALELLAERRQKQDAEGRLLKLTPVSEKSSGSDASTSSGSVSQQRRHTRARRP